MKIELTGIDRWTERLERAQRNLPPNTADALEEVGEKIVQDMKAIVPVKTGALRDSIGKTTRLLNENIRELIIVARKIYAKFVEYGTSKTRPQPFFRIGFENNRPYLRLTLRQKLRESMR